MIIKKKRKSSLANRIFSFKSFILISIVVVIFLGTNLGKEFYRKYQIQKEIDSLKGDINSLEESTYKLSQLIDYYETAEYKEAQARERFNLGKEGESLVVIIKSDDSGDEIENEINNSKKFPNYKKWWNYFFVAS